MLKQAADAPRSEGSQQQRFKVFTNICEWKQQLACAWCSNRRPMPRASRARRTGAESGVAGSRYCGSRAGSRSKCTACPSYDGRPCRKEQNRNAALAGARRSNLDSEHAKLLAGTAPQFSAATRRGGCQILLIRETLEDLNAACQAAVSHFPATRHSHTCDSVVEQ